MCGAGRGARFAQDDKGKLSGAYISENAELNRKSDDLHDKILGYNFNRFTMLKYTHLHKEHGIVVKRLAREYKKRTKRVLFF